MRKVASTPRDFAQGVLAALDRAGAGGEKGHDVDSFGLGTTIATNAFLTRSGARVGLLSTAGHGDSLEIMRVFGRVAGLASTELQSYAATDKPAPIVPRALVREIVERIDCRGEVVVPLDEDLGRRGDPIAPRGGGGGLGRFVSVELPQPAPRAPGPGDCPRGIHPEPRRHPVERRRAQARRVRTQRLDGGQRLRLSRPDPLPGPGRGRPRRPRALGADAGNALDGRSRHRGPYPRACHQHLVLRTRGRSDRGATGGGAGRSPPHRLHRHGGHELRRRAGSGRAPSAAHHYDARPARHVPAVD